jgi:hypothetical protein
LEGTGSGEEATVVEPPRPVKVSHQPRDSEMLHVKKVDFVLFIAMVINCTAQAENKSTKIGIPVNKRCKFIWFCDLLLVNVAPSQAPEPV